MPGPEAARKQHALGGAAGIALLAFALTYRFFPGILHVAPQSAQTMATTASSRRSDATTPATWSAVRAPPPVTVPAEAVVKVDTDALLRDAVRMGPPKLTTKAIAALLKRAADAEQKGALLDPKNGAITLYRSVLNETPDNVDAETALEGIGGAMRDWAIAAIDRGDATTAQRFADAYADLPHADEELDKVRDRLKILGDVLPKLARAAELMRNGHATEPADDNALAIYRDVLRQDPDNHLADGGLADIERAYLDRALAAAAQVNFADADRLLAQASDIRPGSPALLDTRTRIYGIRSQSAQTILAQARSALDAGDADLAEDLAKKAQAISPDLSGLDDFNRRLVNARLYASMKPGQVLQDRFIDIAGSAPAVVVIPTGQFVMGSPADEAGHQDSEEPQRRVRIDVGFAMGQTDVTVGQFREFVRSATYVTDAEKLGSSAVYEESSGRMVNRTGASWQDDYAGARAGDSFPVVNVSWNDANAYAEWVSARTGKHYRLPSETEFEYVVRARTTTRFPWGDGDPDKVVGNLTGEGDRSPSKRSWSQAFAHYSDGYWGPAPVKTFPANPFGLYDVSGNVSEWVEDCWHDNYIRAPRDSAAWVNPGCERHVVRGGSWGSDPDQVRSAFRVSAETTARSARVGIRIARDL